MALTVEAIIALAGVLLGLPAVALSSWQIWKWRSTRQQPAVAPSKSQRKTSTSKRRLTPNVLDDDGNSGTTMPLPLTQQPTSDNDTGRQSSHLTVS